MTTVPYIFTYWEGENFSFLHYLTIKSLHKYNPDVNIIIYTSKDSHNTLRTWTSNEHSIEITNKLNFRDVININPEKIIIKEIDFKEEYGLNNDVSCVFKADFTRIAKLYEHGGIWFDMDILFIKPIPSYMFCDTTEMSYFMYEGAIPTGLISCKARSKYITLLYENIITYIDVLNSKNNNNYQIIGPILWRSILFEHQSILENTMKCIETTDIYPVLYYNLNKIYTNSDFSIPANTWGIHWYNGHQMSKHFINNLKSDNLGNSLIEKYIKEII
jgi:mannosyltransferase OCH1-like enzyme